MPKPPPALMPWKKRWLSSSGSGFLRKKLVKDAPQGFRFPDDPAEFFEPLRIGGFRDPELEIPSVTVLFAQVFQRSLPMPLRVQFRIVGKPELDGPADDGHRVDEPVRFGDQASVNASGCGL